MKLGDAAAVVLVAGTVVLFTVGRSAYETTYAFSPALMAFVKFAVLATFGETLVSRLTTGSYVRSGFGLLPKLIVWGLLGLAIYCAFVIFESGTTRLFFSGGVPPGGFPKVVWAFSISVAMNLIFSPVLMTTHNLTDLFIRENNGHFPLGKLHPGQLLSSVDWDRMWSFVFARTIPLFWIPAHTITFLLPPEFRLMYAAGLSVMLGLFMALVRPGKNLSEGPARRSTAKE